MAIVIKKIRDANEHLIKARLIRKDLPVGVFKPEEIAKAIKQGRP